MSNNDTSGKTADSTSLSQIAVVGRAEVVMPFRAAGFAVFPVESGPAAGAKVEELAGAGYMVVFYTEDLYPHLNVQISRYSRTATPCLVMLPMGAQAAGLARLREVVKRAVGADIFGATAQAARGA
jgi:V/A-type H+-transporting ATPase subunit F